LPPADIPRNQHSGTLGHHGAIFLGPFNASVIVHLEEFAQRELLPGDRFIRLSTVRENESHRIGTVGNNRKQASSPRIKLLIPTNQSSDAKAQTNVSVTFWSPLAYLSIATIIARPTAVTEIARNIFLRVNCQKDPFGLSRSLGMTTL
jgi:hypothetical protein